MQSKFGVERCMFKGQENKSFFIMPCLFIVLDNSQWTKGQFILRVICRAMRDVIIIQVQMLTEHVLTCRNAR